MSNFFANKYVALLLVVTVILLVFVAVYTGNRTKVSFGEDLVSTIVMPFQSISTNVSNGFKKFTNYFNDVDRLTAENKKLTEKAEDLERKYRAVEQYKIENEQLRSLLDLKQNSLDFKTTSAEVVARDPGIWYHAFTIDKGSKDGIKLSQPVITSKGLVGYISEVGTSWAKVASIIDSDSAVACTISRTGDLAIVEGNIDLEQDALCKMTYVAKSSSVIMGDLVETSGLGGVYPKGLLIGTVREIYPDAKSISQYAIIEPAVNFNKISTVLIITND